ncbi:MAG: hypothetical protein HZB40_20395 [Rhodocyclales bacterium]|nr:hypothetical protein [Rhodocyclales bacterium]
MMGTEAHAREPDRGRGHPCPGCRHAAEAEVREAAWQRLQQGIRETEQRE